MTHTHVRWLPPTASPTHHTQGISVVNSNPVAVSNPIKIVNPSISGGGGGLSSFLGGALGGAVGGTLGGVVGNALPIG